MLEGADAWCWDARPFPAFPAREDVWADTSAWASGHWLNGRLGSEAEALLAAILRRGGVDDFEVGRTQGAVSGYVIDRPMRTRDALQPLLQALGMTAGERGGRISLIGDEAVCGALELDRLALIEERSGPVRTRSLEALPAAARVRFIDEGADYQTGATVARGEGDGGSVDADLPAVCEPGLAKALARRLLKGDGDDRLTVALGPLEAIRLEAGDAVAVEGEAGAWTVERVTLDETPTAVLARRDGERVEFEATVWRSLPAVEPAGMPFARILDLPPLPGSEEDQRPIAIVACEPWRPMTVHVGEDAETLTARGGVGSPATVGRLTQTLAPGVLHRWDELNTVVVRLEGPAPSSVSETAMLGGANLAAIETVAGWEIMQFRHAALLGDDVWRLSGLLGGNRGRNARWRRARWRVGWSCCWIHRPGASPRRSGSGGWRESRGSGPAGVRRAAPASQRYPLRR